MCRGWRLVFFMSFVAFMEKPVHLYDPGSPDSVLPQGDSPPKSTNLRNDMADTADSSRKRKEEEIQASQGEAKKKRSDPLQSTTQGGEQKSLWDPHKPINLQLKRQVPASAPRVNGPAHLQFKGKLPVSAPQVKGPPKYQWIQKNKDAKQACTEECKKREGFVERVLQQSPISITLGALDAEGNCKCQVNKEFLDYLTKTKKLNTIAFMAAHAKSPKDGLDWLASNKITVQFPKPEPNIPGMRGYEPRKWELQDCIDGCKKADGYVIGTNQKKIFLSEGFVNEKQNCNCNVTTGIIDFLKEKGLNTTAFEAERSYTLPRGHAWLRQHQIEVLGVSRVF